MENNATSYTLTFTQGSGANVAILAGETKVIATDGGGAGAIVYDAFASLNVGALATGNVTITGNITVSGTVDGRDVATDGTKLDGVEASADVTDVANVGSSLTSFTTTTSFEGADIIPVYDATAATWVKGTVTNVALQGPAGPTGSAGGDGPTGPTGPAGAAGTPSTTINTVGSYGMFRNTSATNYAAGDSVASTSIIWSAAGGVTTAATRSGTWRLMGRADKNDTEIAADRISIFVRIS
jgi:hypothetical protein